MAKGSGKSGNDPLDDLEKTQAALRDSIEQSKKLTEKSQKLIDKVRDQREADRQG